MAETTETTQPVETAATPTVYPGAAFVTIHNSLDTYGHVGIVKWRGDEVTITRSSTGRTEEVVTTERDAVTENALTGMVVPNVRPPYDFRVMILADECTGTWGGFLHLEVRNGKAEIVPRVGKSYPTPIPAWFLSCLRDLVLVEYDQDETA